MDIKEMTIEEMEARKAAIAAEIDTEGADLDALTEEVRAINAELEARKEAETKRAEIRASVAAGAGTVIREKQTEERAMPTIEEIRGSKEYAGHCYHRYVYRPLGWRNHSYNGHGRQAEAESKA